MSTTLALMHNEVALALGNREDIDSLIDGWLNRSQLAIGLMVRIREIETAVNMTATIWNGTVGDIYDMPADFWAPMIIVNTSSNRDEIKLKPLETIIKRIPTPTGHPDSYAIRGMTFVFRPAFEAVDVLEITYKRKLPTMTASVDMTLPDEFAQAIIYDSIVRGLPLVGEEDRMQVFRDMRNDALQFVGDQRGDEMAGRVEGVQLLVDGYDGYRGLRLA